MTIYTELFLWKQFWIITLCVEFSNKVAFDSCLFNLSPHSDELVCYLIQIFFLMGKNKLEIRQYKICLGSASHQLLFRGIKQGFVI